MRIAFAIMKLFPGGGLQRDCLALARQIRNDGHEVVIYTSSQDAGDFVDDLTIVVLPVRRRTNHGKQGEFASALRWAASSQKFDAVVGFDKLPDLDVLYCADPSIRTRMTREPYLFLLPRYRTYHAFERAVFAAARTKVLLLSQRQVNEYRNAWHTPPERLTLLPPTIATARRHPEFRVNGVGARLRQTFDFAPLDQVWLAVAVAPFTKGLDRSLRALRHFPTAQLVVAGLTPTSSHSARTLATQARRLGVAGRTHWVGHREDISELMAAADLLVHPARRDTTGTVILEAVVNGLPVITTAVCGYGEHVKTAAAGIVIDEPFAFKAFLAALAAAEDAGRRALWSAAAAGYGEQPLLYEGRSRAAALILATAAERARVREPLLGNSREEHAEDRDTG